MIEKRMNYMSCLLYTSAIFMLFEAALRKTHEEIYQAQDGGAYPRGEDFQAVG